MKIIITMNKNDIMKAPFMSIMAGMHTLANEKDAKDTISVPSDVTADNIKPEKVERVTNNEPKKEAPKPASKPAPKKEAAKPATKKEEVKKTEPEPEPAPEPVKEPKPDDKPEQEPALTFAIVKDRLKEISHAGGSAKVKEMIKGFGVSKLSEIPEDKYQELMDQAEEIAKNLEVA